MEEDRKWSNVKKVLHSQLNNMSKSELFLGTYYSNMFLSDIKHVSFTLSRYKFASKMIMYQDKISVLELGCQEAFGSLVFEQNVNLEKYVGIDFDHDAMQWNYNNILGEKFIFIEDDFLKCNKIENQKFNLILSLDVIEHIDKKYEDDFCKVISGHITDDGVAIIGTPSVYMNPYACDASKEGHINLYDQKRLYSLMDKYFNNVFIFNMNDEIIHTGFAPMSCYIFAVCTGRK